MHMPYSYTESMEQRHNRLLSARLAKAKILNDRIFRFIEDITKSTIFKDYEKKKILDEFKFVNK
jgi:hypothetical protein